MITLTNIFMKGLIIMKKAILGLVITFIVVMAIGIGIGVNEEIKVEEPKPVAIMLIPVVE